MSGTSAPKGTKFMTVLGAVILVAVAAYYAFASVDAMGLASQTATARVMGKDHRPMSQTYTREIIGGQMRTVPHVNPEMYILQLDLNGERASGVTDQLLFDRVNVGDTVKVTYQRRRLTRALQVVSVSL